MEIWGLKTLALFDIWSIEHFLTGISIDALVHFFHIRKISKKYQKKIINMFV